MSKGALADALANAVDLKKSEVNKAGHGVAFVRSVVSGCPALPLLGWFKGRPKQNLAKDLEGASIFWTCGL